ncbi:Na+-transporting NADH:ubiquinone oxidoreductase subunit C [Methylomarinovum caldicuralii]|uniref:Na(+)-translocating NADH-quinone reductase subunit C n=1 Tax=Methylomarinovum caldicuralii TaxID=438856 RepID=A0AAU9C0E9_9GAMM|nr:NADH:ubiquinone reductase (Na(+)-transporting) subunit C [Methylomarinovum caldicuralii]BCX81013.1 Na+-transporting NADH:ubiquinone oxidoreductase subunit C [Methylomarinovum caldicuralii]
MRKVLGALTVVLSVALVCSFMVTAAAVLLAERQERNLRLERIRHILAVVGIEAAEPLSAYREAIDARLIDLHRAEPVPLQGLPRHLQPDAFDFDKAARDPRYGGPIPPERIGLRRRPRLMPLYVVKGHGPAAGRVALLLVGKGLWSTLYGYLALENDLRHIAGITFFEQKETPGLGGEIANPRWQALWRGKLAYDERGNVLIRVAKGSIPPGSSTAAYQVNGLSGATLTTRAVDRLVRYWLGPEGYGPYLARLRREGER